MRAALHKIAAWIRWGLTIPEIKPDSTCPVCGAPLRQTPHPRAAQKLQNDLDEIAGSDA